MNLNATMSFAFSEVQPVTGFSRQSSRRTSWDVMCCVDDLALKDEASATPQTVHWTVEMIHGASARPGSAENDDSGECLRCALVFVVVVSLVGLVGFVVIALVAVPIDPQCIHTTEMETMTRLQVVSQQHNLNNVGDSVCVRTCRFFFMRVSSSAVIGLTTCWFFGNVLKEYALLRVSFACMVRMQCALLVCVPPDCSDVVQVQTSETGQQHVRLTTRRLL